MKFLTTIISGIIVGVAGVYFTRDFQEEELQFTLSEPARFGDVVYQSLRISNIGWDPATNVSVGINGRSLKESEVRSDAALRASPALGGIGVIERIRRNETVEVSFSFQGPALSPEMVVVKSDRTIATPTERGWRLDWRSFFWGFGTIFAWVVLAIAVPAVGDYKKRALEVESERAKRNATPSAANLENEARPKV